MRSRGFSLVELLVAVGVMSALAAFSLPFLRPLAAEWHLVAAGQAFRTQFRLARSMAVAANAYTAIRFERRGDDVWYAVYRDGNHNGVRAADIVSGRDPLVAGPFPLTGGAPSVRVGINPGVPAIPPDRGALAGDPVQFGRSDMLSFSPLGTATPGTFYLAGEFAQAAVRVTPGTARVRLMVCRGGSWRER
jgi:prepilin-type N-terminal cleavage/methylation domain-containing protein